MKLTDYYIDPQFVLKKKPPLNGRHKGMDVFTWEADRLRHGAIQIGSEIVDPMDGFSQGEQAYLMHAKTFEHFKGKVYVFNKNFFRCLMDSEVGENFLPMIPEEFFGYIAFPIGVLRYKDVDIVGAYLSITRREGIVPMDDLAESGRYLWATFLTRPKEASLERGEYGLVTQYIRLAEDTVKSILNHERFLSVGMEETDVETSKDLIKASLLSLMYINTAEPDLKHLRPRSELSKSQINGMISRGFGEDLENNYVDDIGCALELVSWGWGGIEYRKGEWEVVGYFKSVLYGPGKKLSKTMWFPPSTRERRKELLETTEEKET